MKNKLSFLLTFISTIGSLALAWFKDVDITMLLPSVLGMYILGKTAHSVSAGWAASKDANADTEKVLEMLDKSH